MTASADSPESAATAAARAPAWLRVGVGRPVGRRELATASRLAGSRSAADEVLIKPGELLSLQAALTERLTTRTGRWATTRSWLTANNGFALE